MTAVSPATKLAASPIAKTVFHTDDELSLRRWILAAAAVVLVHAAIVFWLLYIREVQSAGAPPAVITIDLAPLDVAPPTETTPETRQDRK